MPSEKPFLTASALAVVYAVDGSPGSHTTPASAAASAARCMRWLTVQYQATSTTTAHSAMRAIIAPAKITMIWPFWRARDCFVGAICWRVAFVSISVIRVSLSSWG